LTAAPAVTTIYDSIGHSFIITYLQKRNIFVLANERRLRRDKPQEEFQEHAPTENVVI
jgi:hypothetical protein